MNFLYIDRDTYFEKFLNLLNYAIDCIIKLCYYNLANKKAVAPTKNEPPPIKKERQADYNTVDEMVQDYGKN